MNTNDKLRELIRPPLSTANGVAQADRDAAKPFMDRFLDGSSFADDSEELALAFARHRQASITQQAEEVARLRDALKPYSTAPCTCAPRAKKCHSCNARAALSEQPGGEG